MNDYNRSIRETKTSGTTWYVYTTGRAREDDGARDGIVRYVKKIKK